MGRGAKTLRGLGPFVKLCIRVWDCLAPVSKFLLWEKLRYLGKPNRTRVQPRGIQSLTHLTLEYEYIGMVFQHVFWCLYFGVRGDSECPNALQTWKLNHQTAPPRPSARGQRLRFAGNRSRLRRQASEAERFADGLASQIFGSFLVLRHDSDDLCKPSLACFCLIKCGSKKTDTNLHIQLGKKIKSEQSWGSFQPFLDTNMERVTIQVTVGRSSCACEFGRGSLCSARSTSTPNGQALHQTMHHLSAAPSLSKILVDGVLHDCTEELPNRGHTYCLQLVHHTSAAWHTEAKQPKKNGQIV